MLHFLVDILLNNLFFKLVNCTWKSRFNGVTLHSPLRLLLHLVHLTVLLPQVLSSICFNRCFSLKILLFIIRLSYLHISVYSGQGHALVHQSNICQSIALRLTVAEMDELIEDFSDSVEANCPWLQTEKAFSLSRLCKIIFIICYIVWALKMLSITCQTWDIIQVSVTGLNTNISDVS